MTVTRPVDLGGLYSFDSLLLTQFDVGNFPGSLHRFDRNQGIIEISSSMNVDLIAIRDEILAELNKFLYLLSLK